MEAALAVEERTAEPRTEIQSMDSKIVELRARLEVGHESLHNVLLAIGHACQTVLARTGAAPRKPSRNASSYQSLRRNAWPNLPPNCRCRASRGRLAARAMPVAPVSSLALSAVGFAILHYL
jgi:hypothetical protein